MKPNITKYLIFDDKNIHEFDLLVEEVGRDTRFTLLYSNNNVWSDNIRGTPAVIVCDTGNGLVISDPDIKYDRKDNTYSVNYSTSRCISIILNSINKLQKFYTDHKMIPFTDIHLV